MVAPLSLDKLQVYKTGSWRSFFSGESRGVAPARASRKHILSWIASSWRLLGVCEARSPTLAPFVGRTINIRYDPRDLSEIRIYDHDTFICTAIDEAHPNQRLTLREIETARRARRRQLRKDINDRIPTMTRQELHPSPPPPAAPPRRKLRTYEEDD